MKRPLRPTVTRGGQLATALAAALVLALDLAAASGGPAAVDSVTIGNPGGKATTLRAGARIGLENPFFHGFGAAGRSCVTCHDPLDGWSLNPEHVRARLLATDGRDPLFLGADAPNTPTADVSSAEARQSAYSLLLTRGVIRIGMTPPAGAEFAVDSVEDPYGYATPAELSLYRRPLPSTNLRFQPVVMWDGRETHDGASLEQDLLAQARSALRDHAGVTGVPDDQVARMVSLESGLFTAQAADRAAGRLDANGGHGGPLRLSRLRFRSGSNDPFAPGFRDVFQLYTRWRTRRKNLRGTAAARALIARGEQLFSRRVFNISDVPGLNDVVGQPVIRGTCATCHNTPGAGSNSFGRMMDLGFRRVIRSSPDLPLYTLRNTATGELLQTTDPGRAMITGRWADVGKFKIPVLRGLASRGSYFHDGSAKTLADVVEFYYDRFNIEAGPNEKEALAAFLKTL